MGLLLEGKWHTDWYDTTSTKGEFIRKDAQFRQTISTDKEKTPFKPEAGRYHLFVSLACPWAHRTLIMRSLKKLEDVISISVVEPEMLDDGWEITSLELSKMNAETVRGLGDVNYIHQIYTKANSLYTGRVTVPILWDKKTSSIVNNESSEILRILNFEFNDFTTVKTDYYPESLRGEIDEVNALVYSNINNGVYKTGFATTQQAYEVAFNALFETLESIELRLDTQRYLVGNSITEADWRLFTTLIRFDAVYYGHFKTNLKRIEDYPNLSNYLRDLYQQEGVVETVNFEHIKTHYYYSHEMINPTRIVPLGPVINYMAGHDRNRFDVPELKWRLS
ncbi:MAG: putative glutathione S-transferase [Enterobacterales bacterium]|jgi:putative glutathione S-transferase